MSAAALRPLGRLASLPWLASPVATSSSRAFALSSARRVRLPHQPPSPFVASLERFSPVNHKVEPGSGGSPNAQLAPRNDFRKFAVCLVIFAGIVYCIYLPADMPFLSETDYKAFPVEWIEVLGAPDSKEGRYKVVTLRLPDEHPMVKGNLKSEAAPYHLMVKDPNLQIERVRPTRHSRRNDRANRLTTMTTYALLSALHHLPAAAARHGFGDAAFASRQEGGQRRGLALHSQPQAL
jgi:hypothetical protein